MNIKEIEDEIIKCEQFIKESKINKRRAKYSVAFSFSLSLGCLLYSISNSNGFFLFLAISNLAVGFAGIFLISEENRLTTDLNSCIESLQKRKLRC